MTSQPGLGRTSAPLAARMTEPDAPITTDSGQALAMAPGFRYACAPGRTSTSTPLPTTASAPGGSGTIASGHSSSGPTGGYETPLIFIFCLPYLFGDCSRSALTERDCAAPCGPRSSLGPSTGANTCGADVSCAIGWNTWV